LSNEGTSFLDAQLARGGILLWAHPRDLDIENTVLQVLRRHSIRASIHDYPVAGAAVDGSGQSPDRQLA
jgi:hypothetical protein